MSIWKEYIEEFNSGDLDFLSAFNNDIELFVEFITNKGLIKYLKFSDQFTSEIENKVLKAFIEHHKQGFIDYVLEVLHDVKYQNGMFYLVTEQIELVELFGENRNSLSISTIRTILDGEGFFEWFDNTTDDVYRDVIEELNKKNLEEFYNLIIFKLKDTPIETHTELLESIAESQGHPEYVIVDKENIKSIVDDNESIMEIIDSDLNDMGSDLKNLHFNSYNNAMESTLYNQVWISLGEFFVTKEKQWVSVPFYTGPPEARKVARTVENIKIPIRNFESTIIEFIDYSDTTLSYWGSFLSVLSETLKDSSALLKVYPYDYPDNDEVRININDMFSDYVY